MSERKAPGVAPTLSRKWEVNPGKAAVELAGLVLSAFLLPLFSLLPKEKGLWVFFPSHERSKFSGNLRSLFLHVRCHHPEIRPRWVTESRAVEDSMRRDGLPVKWFRLLPLWSLARAEYIFIDSINWKLVFGRLRLVQLWHGVGYKNVGLRNPNRGRLELRLMRQHFRKYHFFPASSESDRQFVTACFETENVAVTGTPRNDILLQQVSSRRPEWIPEGRKIVLYAPTFRDEGKANPFSQVFWNRINKWAEREGAVFVVKKHPRDAAVQVPEGEWVIDATSRAGNLEELLLQADVLVTDYSSIATDFVLTGRPIIFYTYDFDRYIRSSRSLYYNLQEVLPGPFAKDEDNLLRLLEERRWVNDPIYQEKYAGFRERFHQWSTGSASERIVQELIGRGRK